MSEFINAKVLASLRPVTLRKGTASRPKTPTPAPSEPRLGASDEPTSSSRIRIARGYALS